MIWRDVPGFEGLYEISDGGLVRSWATWHLIQPRKTSDGAWTVTLRRRKKLSWGKNKYESKTFRVNRLVALVYIPNPDNYKFVKFKDGDKDHNVVENLYWSRTKQNVKLKEVVPGKIYRNKKHGTLYSVYTLVRHSELPNELMVAYGRVDAAPDDIPWVRPLELFKVKFEELEESKQKLTV